MQLEHPCGSSMKIPRRRAMALVPHGSGVPSHGPQSSSLFATQPRLGCSPCAHCCPSPIAACSWCMWDAREPRVHGSSIPSCHGVPPEPCLSQPHSPACGAGQPPAPHTDPPSPARMSQHLLALPGLNEDRRHHSTQGAPPGPGPTAQPSQLGSFGTGLRTMSGSQIQHHPDGESGGFWESLAHRPCVLLCCKARAAPRSPGVQTSPSDTPACVPLPQCCPGCWHCPSQLSLTQFNSSRSWQHLQWMYMKDLGVSNAPGGSQASHT